MFFWFAFSKIFYFTKKFTQPKTVLQGIVQRLSHFFPPDVFSFSWKQRTYHKLFHLNSSRAHSSVASSVFSCVVGPSPRPSPEGTSCEIVQYLSFRGWFLSLGLTCSGPFHRVPCWRTTLLLKAADGCPARHSSARLAVGGWARAASPSRTLWITLTRTRAHTYPFETLHSALLGSGSRIVGSCGHCIFRGLRSPTLVYTVATSVHVPTDCARVLLPVQPRQPSPFGFVENDV